MNRTLKIFVAVIISAALFISCSNDTQIKYWDNGNIGWLSVTDFNNDVRYVYTTEKRITKAGLENSNTKLLKKDGFRHSL